MPTTAVLERKRVPAPAPPKPAVSPTASAPEQPGAAARALARSLPGGQDAVKSQPVAPGEEIELAGGSKLALTPEADEWLAHKGPAGVRVRLGSLAHGTLQVRRTSSGLNTTDQPQVLPWPHPALVGLRRAVGLEPVLAVQVRSGLVKGHLSMWDGKHLLGPGAWVSKLEKAADALGWVGLERPQLDIGTNELQGPMLVVRTKTLKFWVSGGFLSGSGTFALEGESVTFEATLIGKVPGLTPITLPVKRAPDGSLTGSFTAGISLRNFSGQLTAAFGHGLVDIHGTANYNTERMSGSVTIVATDQQTAKALTDSQLPEEVQSAGRALVEPLPAVPNGAVPAAAPDGAAQAAGPRPGRRVVVGWGTLRVRLADWLGGDALVVMEHDGNVTVVGKVTPKMDHPLVEQQPEKTLHLFSFSAGAYYGIPVVGDVHLKASVDLEAFARFGPVTLDKMELDGNWSTNPERLKSLALTGTLNASAVAGLRLTAEGKVGLEILEHSIDIGAGMKATAGIKGYVVAVPRIGYREIADPQAGKRGEFFIGGHMEIAAQPFLGLEGYFFVDLDSPWWSPAPSKRWPWPIGSLEYALPGMFAIGADVEHVLGSGRVPEVKFGQVSFDPDKFLTDLVDEKVPNKVARDDRKAGSWQEFPQPADAAKTAEAPGAGKSTGPAPGAPPRASRATSAAPPRKDAATPPTLPRGARPPSPAGGARKSGVAADGGKVVSPEVQKRWLAALADLRELKVQARKNPLSAEELATALSDLRARHRFTELTGRRQGDHWHLHASMNPKLDEELEGDNLHEATVLATQGTDVEAALRGEDVARRAGVPELLYQSGRVFIAADFPDIDVPPIARRRPGPQRQPITRRAAAISLSRMQEVEWTADLWLINEGGWLVDARVNQRQVAPGGEMAATARRPDLSLEVETKFGNRMVHFEYDRAPGTRSIAHAKRILQADPTAIVILKIVDFEGEEPLRRTQLRRLRAALRGPLRKKLKALLGEP
jgi:hypothetical protein